MTLRVGIILIGQFNICFRILKPSFNDTKVIALSQISKLYVII